MLIALELVRCGSMSLTFPVGGCRLSVGHVRRRAVRMVHDDCVPLLLLQHEAARVLFTRTVSGSVWHLHRALMVPGMIFARLGFEFCAVVVFLLVVRSQGVRADPGQHTY